MLIATISGTLAALRAWLHRFDRLRHDAVVGGDHQHDDVGELGAAGAHRGERRVARRVEEGDDALVGFDVVRADVLGDAAGFAGGDLGAADVVEQRGLAVVDVAHDGDHRRTRSCSPCDFSTLRREQVRPRRRRLSALDRLVAELLDHQHRGVVVDDLVDGGHHAHLEQRLDHVAALQARASAPGRTR